LVSFVVTGLCLISSAQAGEATADTFVRGAENGDTNYGNNSSVTIKNANGNGYDRKGYIRFDVSGTIMEASLDLTVSTNNDGGGGTTPQTFTIEVYGLAESLDHTWTENDITWNNAPGNDTSSSAFAEEATLLGSFIVEPLPVGNMVSFSDPNLVDFINSDTDNQVTLLLRRTAGTSSSHNVAFASKEHTSYSAPTLNTLAATRAFGPDPTDGSLLIATWASLSWRAMDSAVSHDVYIGDNFDDVKNGTGDTFVGNQVETTQFIGFSGYPYPDGLVPGTTYYWRIDEVNEANPNSPWKGEVWSFSMPPNTAYNPIPDNGAELVDLDVRLKWTPGFGSKLHYIVFGQDFDQVNNAPMGVPNGTNTYNPGQLELAKTYYWRIDEFDGLGINKGDVWSFTTEGAASGPNPANGALGVNPLAVLIWDAGAVAASHEVYFGSDAGSVANATKASPEYKGPKALGEESYETGRLSLGTTYYWRIDEVNSVNPNSPWTGKVWSFTTSDFFVIDDFERYDAGENQIWFSWHDGLGYGTPGTADYYAGNGTGAAVGDENTLSYTEETIVHGGNQSMPIAYDNDKQGYSKYSEVELTLTDQRDWTAEGMAELSIWFRGVSASVGSFVEAPAGTYTMTAGGTDIWNAADEFHYAFKTLTGPGTIIVKVESVENTDPWAKAGVMIRETLDAGSKFAAVYITPTNTNGTPTQGCRFQARTDTAIDATSDTSVATPEQMAIVAPYWIKLERDVSGNFRGYYSANGTTWQGLVWRPTISMSTNVYIGLALTSHNAALTCEAKFSNVTITGTLGTQWANQDIGIFSNDPEPLYVAISNSTGAPGIVYHDDATATNVDTWTEWVIPLQSFADQGINLTNVDRIAIGMGTRGNTTNSGGSGTIYIDDIRLYQPRTAP
jgi:hypothetical protein